MCTSPTSHARYTDITELRRPHRDIQWQRRHRFTMLTLSRDSAGSYLLTLARREASSSALGIGYRRRSQDCWSTRVLDGV